jgi:hypothetical protein
MTAKPLLAHSLVNLLVSLALVASSFMTPSSLAAAPNAPDHALVATAWFTFYDYLLQTTEGFTPPVAARAIGYASVTLYEAVVPGLPEYQSLVGQLNGLTTLPKPISGQRYHWPTVANSALAAITRYLFSNTSLENNTAIATLESQLTYHYQQDLDTATFARSVHYGRILAAAIQKWAMTDGGHEGQLHNFQTEYQPVKGAGFWLPTAPAFLAKPLQPTWGNNRTFVLKKDQMCLAKPPAHYSEERNSFFYRQAQEVYNTVRSLTPEQRLIALYWADDPGRTATPAGHSLAIVTQILQQKQATLALAAETYAKVGIAVADAFIGCWQTKYQYNRIRPISYIQVAIDSFWNRPQVTDPVITPPFPEYTSGHSVQSGAVAEVLTSLFGNQFSFTDHTHVRRGFLPRSFDSFWVMAGEAAISRLYGGIHYRDAIENGLVQGRCIGQQVLALRFKR